MAIDLKADVGQSTPWRTRSAIGLGLFALTLFLSASLLFCVQPMVAKLVLPLLGGSPAVWNTCMVFFQAMLLAGYAYAHATTRHFTVRRQAILHCGLLLLPLLVLPFSVSPEMSRTLPSATNPTFWLLGSLLVVVGLPFFVVSATAPMLQRWFTATGHPSSSDPYFLYGASNLGSMLALLGYPLVMEPYLRQAQQSGLWAVGYGVLVLLTLACGVVAGRSLGDSGPSPDRPIDADKSGWPGIGRRLRWVALAFVPSSLMLGITTYLTTDIAAVPLLWIIPLGLYLLSFILVFARRPPLEHRWMVRVMPMAVVALILTMSVSEMQVFWMPLHLIVFFVVAMVCHGELARLRPDVRHLTAFYLAMSFGGVLGGIFNALVAPVLFDRITEYPLAMVLACLVLPGRRAIRTLRGLVLDFLLPLTVGACAVGLIWFSSDRPYAPLLTPLALSVASALCFTFKERPIRFAMGLGMVLLASGATSSNGRIVHRERSFFGVLRVVQDPEDQYRELFHGSTLHGRQSLDPARSGEPLTYYHRTGPIGQVFAAFAARPTAPAIAIVGLGAGSLACYAEPGQRWTFYEIDPAVARLARDPRSFTYLKNCRADSLDLVLGDARLRLLEAPDAAYGLIVLDAFSSDAIPIHLLTREAMRIYRGKLAEGGMLALHISNRYLDLAPVVAALASDAGLVGRIRIDKDLDPEDARRGKTPSIWVAMAAREADLGPLAKDERWTPLAAKPDAAVWSDDFSDIVRHFAPRWR